MQSVPSTSALVTVIAWWTTVALFIKELGILSDLSLFHHSDITTSKPHPDGMSDLQSLRYLLHNITRIIVPSEAGISVNAWSMFILLFPPKL